MGVAGLSERREAVAYRWRSCRGGGDLPAWRDQALAGIEASPKERTGDLVVTTIKLAWSHVIPALDRSPDVNEAHPLGRLSSGLGGSGVTVTPLPRPASRAGSITNAAP